LAVEILSPRTPLTDLNLKKPRFERAAVSRTRWWILARRGRCRGSCVPAYVQVADVSGDGGWTAKLRVDRPHSCQATRKWLIASSIFTTTFRAGDQVRRSRWLSGQSVQGADHEAADTHEAVGLRPPDQLVDVGSAGRVGLLQDGQFSLDLGVDRVVAPGDEGCSCCGCTYRLTAASTAAPYTKPARR